MVATVQRILHSRAIIIQLGVVQKRRTAQGVGRRTVAWHTKAQLDGATSMVMRPHGRGIRASNRAQARIYHPEAAAMPIPVRGCAAVCGRASSR
eukprot:5079691-Prymnesium_polylepis.1